MTATTTFNAIPYPQLTDVKTIEPQFLAMSNQADSRYVARFSNASARDAANPTPTAGTMAYCVQESLLFQYTGTAWLPFLFQKTVVKANVETSLSTTLQPDDQLLFFTEPNSVYHGELHVAYSGASITAVAKFAWTIPTGATITRGTFGLSNLTNDRTNSALGQPGIKDTSFRSVGGAGGGTGTYASYSENFILRTASTGGNVNLTWAQATASATPLDLAVGASFLSYTKIS